MRLPVGNRETAAQCPHLGLAEDPFKRGAHAAEEHRCYAHLGRERIDLGHQKRFCLTSAHGTCPFLLVNAREVKRDWIAEGRTWWRSVSPAHQDLTAAQLGRWVGLGVAAAAWAATQVARFAVCVAKLLLQTWRSVRPHPTAAIVEVEDVAPMVAQIDAAPAIVVVEAEPLVKEEVPLTVGREDAKEWFWRAKNAETLDDLIKCLERAHALDPGNEMIASNLDLAKERREVKRKVAKVKPPRKAATPPLHLYSRPRTNIVMRLATALLGLLRTSAGLAVLAVGGVVLVSGLPARVRSELPTPWLPDVSGLTSLVHVPLGGGYDLGMAFPYAIGFLALFVGFGLLHREPSPSGRL
jgi:hypothetical protein